MAHIAGMYVLQKEHLKVFINGNWHIDDFLNYSKALKELHDFYFCQSVLTDEIANIQGNVIIVEPGTKVGQIFSSKEMCLRFLATNGLGYRVVGFQKTEMFSKKKDYAGHREQFSLVSEFYDSSFPKLDVVKIAYSSPGFTDFAGLGVVIGHLKDTCFRVIQFFEGKEKRKLENEKLKVELQLMQVERTKKFVAVLKESGFNKEEIKLLMVKEIENSIAIGQLIRENKIERVE